ncbi:MAG: AAA family ATPase, partial [Deferribacteraceae bacterium]|nr:AAA family ATPase [Deferribacteraceae bacterium]
MRAYTAFFGFKFEPFERAVNLDLFYLSEQHKNALAMLETFLTSEGSLALLLGESGVGKSLTIKKFLSQLPSGVCYTYINLPNFTEGDLLKKLLADFVDAPINDDHPREQFARFLAQIDRGALIIAVDGAHTLSSQSLLTLLALKENGVKIILSGLASLRERVELQGAIDAEFEIPTLSFASCKEYLSYRVKQAGSTLELPNPLAKQIWLVSKGNPLIINALMKRLFAAAFLDNSLSLKERYFTRAALSLNLAGKVERKNP